jgi:ssDNA-binding Zn-finger/Zn-ribbon topoisomerase 1
MEGTMKRKPRKGANICPACGTSMRVIFISKDVGGFLSLPGYVGCGQCKVVRKVYYTELDSDVKMPEKQGGENL